jgi:hypothetical protein
MVAQNGTHNEGFDAAQRVNAKDHAAIQELRPKTEHYRRAADPEDRLDCDDVGSLSSGVMNTQSGGSGGTSNSRGARSGLLL